MTNRIITLVFFICAISTSSEAIILPVPGTPQQQTNWCWASCSETIVEWLGGSVNQCTLADELRVASGWGSDQCCNYGYRTLPWEGHICNKGNWLYGSHPRPIEDILSDRNIGSSGVGNSLSQSAVQTEVNAGCPFVFRWDWLLHEGAHALVCRGQEGSTTFFFDPWPENNGGFRTANYDWVVHSEAHDWTRTLRITDSPDPPIPDVKVNGQDGTYYANTWTNLAITARLTDGLYAGTPADWWIILYYDGVWYYLDQNGNWTTTPSAWSQEPLTDKYYTIYSGALPVGTWTIYFGVDLTQNGVLDDPLYYDYSTIVVQ